MRAVYTYKVASGNRKASSEVAVEAGNMIIEESPDRHVSKRELRFEINLLGNCVGRYLC